MRNQVSRSRDLVQCETARPLHLIRARLFHADPRPATRKRLYGHTSFKQKWIRGSVGTILFAIVFSFTIIFTSTFTFAFSILLAFTIIFTITFTLTYTFASSFIFEITFTSTFIYQICNCIYICTYNRILNSNYVYT